MISDKFKRLGSFKKAVRVRPIGTVVMFWGAGIAWSWWKDRHSG